MQASLILTKTGSSELTFYIPNNGKKVIYARFTITNINKDTSMVCMNGCNYRK